MYYRLKEPWSFRGWKKLPYALRAEYGSKKHDRPFFFAKDIFMTLLYFNGEEDVDSASFSEMEKQIVTELLENDILEKSETVMKPLQPWQRYHVFNARYTESVHWSITGRCNFNCRHCLVSAPDMHHPQLPLSDCLHIIDEMASCGINKVDITGGEPLVRNDFEEIVKALAEHGIDIGVLFTNASLLKEDVIMMMRKYHQYPTFQLSFDGLGHHDWLRGIKGAEEQADAAFRLLQKLDCPAAAAMCIHRGNKDSLKATVDYLAGYGVRALRVNAPQNLGLWKQYSEQYALSEEEIWSVYREYIPHYFADGMPLDIDLDGYFHCRKGSTDYNISYVHHAAENGNYEKIPYCESMHYNLYIGPEGRLAPCMGFSDTALKDRFPSVLEEPLGRLTLQGYYHDVSETRLSDLLAANSECAACEHFARCSGGCMVEGITDEGDYLVPDPRCCYFHKHFGEEAVRKVCDEAIMKCGKHSAAI